MSNPHEKLAMEFFSPPGPSAREWRIRPAGDDGWSRWRDGIDEPWPAWSHDFDYEIRLKPQTITLPERTIPKPLDVGELVDGEHYWVADPTEPGWTFSNQFEANHQFDIQQARRGLYYPHTDQGKADAIAAAKGMRGWRD